MDSSALLPWIQCWENNPNKIQINSWKQNFHQLHVEASVKREKQMQKKTYNFI